MKIIIVLLFICFFVISCEGNKNKLEVIQTVDISDKSNIENCDIFFTLRTNVWRNKGKANCDIIYSNSIYEISEFDLEEKRIEEKLKAEKLFNCLSALMATENINK